MICSWRDDLSRISRQPEQGRRYYGIGVWNWKPCIILCWLLGYGRVLLLGWVSNKLKTKWIPLPGATFLSYHHYLLAKKGRKAGKSSAYPVHSTSPPGEGDIPEKGNAGLVSQGKDITPLNHRRNPPPVMTTFICSRMIPVGSLLYSWLGAEFLFLYPLHWVLVDSVLPG